jgi:hypothetical protein
VQSIALELHQQVLGTRWKRAAACNPPICPDDPARHPAREPWSRPCYFRTMTIVAFQCWIARTTLGWTASDLARAAEVSDTMVGRFERGGALRASSVEAIQRALEKAGVIFIDADEGGPGARLRSQGRERKP